MKWILIILVAASGFWFSFLKIYSQNKAIDAAYDSYHLKNYEETLAKLSFLRDSLGYQSTGLQLNRAHSTYQRNGFSGLNGTNITGQADSTYLGMVESTLYEYTRLWESEANLASRAYNQTGMVTFKSRTVANQPAEEEKLIVAAMSHFKSALRKDYNNEKARYNYEILRKYKEFPEQIMGYVRELVKQRRYVDAYNLLAPYAQNDGRFAMHAEFAKRLGDIANIEVEYGED